jgi:hypothetical protein
MTELDGNPLAEDTAEFMEDAPGNFQRVMTGNMKRRFVFTTKRDATKDKKRRLFVAGFDKMQDLADFHRLFKQSVLREFQLALIWGKKTVDGVDVDGLLHIAV